MIRRRTRLTIALLVGPTLAGCSVGDIRRPPPDPPTPPAVVTSPPVFPFDEVREVHLAVDDRYDPPFVEFTDARHGYALFATCARMSPEPDCPALLYATADGGWSWRTLRHPRPVADNQQLYTAANLLVLLSEPHGWYTSTDGGTTFAHSPAGPPPVWQGAQGRFQVVGSTGRVAEWDGRRLRPLATQPDLPAITTVASRDDQIVVAALVDGEPVAAMSSVGGGRWWRPVVPAPEGEVAALRATIDATGTAWLIGERPDRTGFPALWMSQGGRWRAVVPQGRPERITSLVPVGHGRVVVTGPDGAGLVAEGRYHRMSWPLTSEHYLTVLADGTLCARGPADVVLVTGQLLHGRWARVVLARR